MLTTNAKAGSSVSPQSLPMKDSVLACVFLSLYVGAYMAAGFIGLTAIEWAWTKLVA